MTVPSDRKEAEDLLRIALSWVPDKHAAPPTEALDSLLAVVKRYENALEPATYRLRRLAAIIEGASAGFVLWRDELTAIADSLDAALAGESETEGGMDAVEFWHQKCRVAEAVVERYENDLGKQRRYTGELLRERDEARAVVERYENALRDAAKTAGHLLDMIPQQVWRDTGGDDGQGHYEGDYRAALIAEDIAGWAALAGAEESQ